MYDLELEPRTGVKHFQLCRKQDLGTTQGVLSKFMTSTSALLVPRGSLIVLHMSSNLIFGPMSQL